MLKYGYTCLSGEAAVSHLTARWWTCVVVFKQLGNKYEKKISELVNFHAVQWTCLCEHNSYKLPNVRQNRDNQNPTVCLKLPFNLWVMGSYLWKKLFRHPSPLTRWFAQLCRTMTEVVIKLHLIAWALIRKRDDKQSYYKYFKEGFCGTCKSRKTVLWKFENEKLEHLCLGRVRFLTSKFDS